MSTHPSLSTSLTSLRSSVTLLNSSISILETGTSDLPRLTRVLQQTRHFELLPSSTLHSAQEAVLSELTPEIESLIQRVEGQVEKLERREQGMRARWELNEGRLGRDSDSAAGFQRRRPSGSTGGVQARQKDTTEVKQDPRAELKAKQLRAKKQRLSYAVERLTLQAQQTERKLRQSMAAQEVRGAAGLTREEVDEDDF